MVNIYDNKEAFLKLKPKRLIILFILIILVIIVITIFIIKIKAYDNYQTKGYINCEKECFIETLIPTSIAYEKIKIDNKDITYSLINKEIVIDKENYISYYKITLKSDLEYSNNEIIDINFYYNKQRIIEKIKDKMF